ncbi:thioredoxin reductase [Halorarum halobium]|uniref:thioredoxin reductase n=1 Tax=Halorarum halobium TaxID=3075121 RepID=UPI0028A7A283|nr:thioredoxin reductase [Halobaculum sp. XH14]
MAPNETRSSEAVVVVGGGPTGATAGVFTARYGLDTVVFDRGVSALQRCAFLENYPGFPGGIDVGTFSDLLCAQIEAAGCTLIEDTVTSVTDAPDGEGFLVETGDGRRLETDRVVASAWYDGDYLRPLGGDAMFETHDHGDGEHEHFDPDYADDDGRTPVEGLYVAAPAGQHSVQAVVAAGHGAHVARSLLADRRADQGYPDGVAPRYDWMRRDSEFAGEWGDRDRWREWYESEAGTDHDLDEERFVELRERYIDRAFETRVPDEEIEERSREGLRRLVETLGPERVLDAMDEETVRAHVESDEGDADSSDGRDAPDTT